MEKGQEQLKANWERSWKKMKNMTWVVEYPGVAKWIQWVEENAGVSISPFAASWVITKS